MQPLWQEDVETVGKYIEKNIEKKELSPAQLDELIDIYIECKNPEERKGIALMYKHYFTNPLFVQRMTLRHSQRFGKTHRSVNQDSDAQIKSEGRNLRVRELRSAIDTELNRLQGLAMAEIELGVVCSREYNQAVIDLYSTKFSYPDRPELQRLVTVPQQVSTRTRKKLFGNFSWFIACTTTKEIACAVTAHVHRSFEVQFIEVPLFATALGYERMGFARLLNALLQQHCIKTGCQFILISADTDAVGFWTSKSIGYEPIPPHFKARVMSKYDLDCVKFFGSKLLVWITPTEKLRLAGHAVQADTTTGLDLVDAALSKLPSNVMLRGTSMLPVA